MSGAVKRIEKKSSHAVMQGAKHSARYQNHTELPIQLRHRMGHDRCLPSENVQGQRNTGLTTRLEPLTYASGSSMRMGLGRTDIVVQRCYDETSEDEGEGQSSPPQDHFSGASSTQFTGITNWKGDTVTIPAGHIMSPRDPAFSAPPIIVTGPFTTTQKDMFLAGNSARTKLAPHHRHQIPVRDGGVIDEIPGPGHPDGNQHTGGTPRRHPARSIFRHEPGGEELRKAEIKRHWENKGARLQQVGPESWIDPGMGI